MHLFIFKLTLFCLQNAGLLADCYKFLTNAPRMTEWELVLNGVLLLCRILNAARRFDLKD